MTTRGTVHWTGASWRARVTYADKSRGWVPLPSSIGAEQLDQAQALAAELALRARERLPPSARAAESC
jgi:hypothetical protein